ncbi:MAG: HPr family phosphocarrier protein [Verrucomicrobia bacterium]|nr:HPr family phosphocarrier protein [Verrucomicrobiota bacterium]
MIQRSAIVQNHQGIHLRPSALIIKEIQSYAGDVWVQAAAGKCDLKSIMGLMALGLTCGSELAISVDGPDEEAICERLVEIFETHFDFPPIPEPQIS